MAEFVLAVLLGASAPLVTFVFTSLVSISSFLRLPDHRRYKWAIGGGWALFAVWLNWSMDQMLAGALGWLALLLAVWFIIPGFAKQIMAGDNWMLHTLVIFRLGVERGLGRI